MKSVLRLLFPLVAIPTFIAIALVIAATVIFPQEEMRKMAAEHIGKSIHRQVEFGRVHLRWNGVTIDSVRISEVPTFQAGTLCDAKGVHLGWHLRSLWQGLDIRNKTLTRSSGDFVIREFRNPHYTARDFSVEWSLKDMDATGSRLNGWATVKQGAGALQNIDKLMAKSPSTKIALTPVLALMNLQRMGVLKLGLPDLRYWPIQGIHGDYRFDKGVMTIRKFEIQSKQLQMNTTGTVKLGPGALALNVHLQVPPTSGSGAMDAQLQISGTTAKPQVDLSSLKKQAFRGTIKDLINDPKRIKKDIDAIKNLFR